MASFIWPLLILFCGAVAYHNSFAGVFVFDDATIFDTPRLRDLTNLTGIVLNTNRPLLDLSFAINYALCGNRPFGYHLFNLLVHLGCALFLFGILRRTFLSEQMKTRSTPKAEFLAGAIALIWVVHPLTTSSVTYIIQRAESLMGLFYLGTLYCAIRAFSDKSRVWTIAAVLLCVMGMGIKEVMVTCPLLILLYHRYFQSCSLMDCWKKCRGLYIGLFLTWLIPLGLLTLTDHYSKTVGFQLKTITPAQYLLTQPGVILHYLKLCLIPHPLCLDYYAWPIAQSFSQSVLATMLVTALLAAAAWGTRQKNRWGFWGLWPFVILAVSSSFIPIQDVAFEHRMYLPLIGVLTLLVLCADFTLERFSLGAKQKQEAGTIVLLVIVVGLTHLTILRNKDYHDEALVWKKVVDLWPSNVRALNETGLALIEAGKESEAEPYLVKALELRPDYIKPYNNLGMVYLNQGELQKAEQLFAQALSMKPDYAEVLNNLGLTLARAGNLVQAKQHYFKAIKINPHYAESFNNLGVISLKQQKYSEAEEYFLKAIKLKPHYASAYNNLGIVFIARNDWPQAESRIQKALSLKSDYPKALNNLGVVYKNSGRWREATQLFQHALRLTPQYPEAQRNLAETQSWLGRDLN